MASYEGGLGVCRDHCRCWLSGDGPRQHASRDMVRTRMYRARRGVRTAAPLHSERPHWPGCGISDRCREGRALVGRTPTTTTAWCLVQRAACRTEQRWIYAAQDRLLVGLLVR